MGESGVLSSEDTGVHEITDTLQPPKKLKKPLDNNVYSTKKTVAQGMMDLALLTANASQLKLVLKYNQEKSAIFFIHVSCICISITLQIIVGVMLILNSRYDINRPSHHSRADLMNNLTVIGIFLVTVVNVIAASFSDST
ncbi:ninjurin-1 [Trichonephila inaurata madagascariensis]|uniref:Ninjurin-1 n=1 Tax=Trichonephila inaurata madagascariensis TaxID=2747483 RepID=A0A8X7CNP4_9ARAC|nr:ninjurin-1 [Trichonephila inaurata madagascariensis]